MSRRARPLGAAAVIEAVEGLRTACTDDGDPDACLAFRDQLAALGRPARLALEGLLDDPSTDVRVRSLEALALIGDKRAVPAVHRVLESDSHPDVQGAAVAALTRLHGKNATRSLLRKLDSSDDGAVVDTLLALARLRDPSSLDGIRSAGEKLWERKRNPASLAVVAAAYIEDGVRSVASILADETADLSLRSYAGLVLGHSGRPEAVEVLRQHLFHPAPRLRDRAIRSLDELVREPSVSRNIDADSIARDAERVMRHDSSGGCRMFAASLIAGLAQLSSLPALDSAATNDPDPQVRSVAGRMSAAMRGDSRR